MNKTNIRFPKGSKEQKHLKNQVMAFINLNGYANLLTACNKTKHNYQIIYGQLNGYRICRVSDIEDFIQAIDKKKRIEIQNSLPVISNRHG